MQKMINPVSRACLIIFLFGVFCCLPKQTLAAAGETKTYLGKVYTGDKGLATRAYLDMPKGFTFGPGGELYIADTVNNAIRKINKAGVITTYSGNGSYGNQDGAIAKSTWSEPEGITFDGQGAFYVADTGSNKIRKIKGNSVTTLPLAGLRAPQAIRVLGKDLYISDTGNKRIIKASIDGKKSAIFAANIATPLKLALGNGQLFVTELDKGNVLAYDLRTRKKTVIATGLTEPRALYFYRNYLYLAAGPSGIENEIWRIDPATKEKTLLTRQRENELLNQTADMLIGNWQGTTRIFLLQSGGSSIQTTDLEGQDWQIIAGRHRYGDETGTSQQALLGRPESVVASPDGTKLYISYAQGNKIAEFYINANRVRVIAGHVMDNYREGTGLDARFSDVTSMKISRDSKTLYLADRNSQRIRTLDIKTGTTKYLTGAGLVNLLNPQNPTGVINPNAKNGYQEGGPCPDTYDLKIKGCAYFDRPTGLALTKDGKSLYVADASNNRIRKVTVATGRTSFIAGSGNKAFKDGIGTAASFNGPFTIALSADEKTLFVADKYNNAIRSINLATKRVTTLAGTGQQGYREGTFAKAMFSLPEYIDRGPDGQLYVSEAGSFRVRQLDLKKKMTSLVSGSGRKGLANGAGPASAWNAPKGMAFLSGRIIVADFKNDLIRSINLK